MNRTVIVLLLLIANAVVSTSKTPLRSEAPLRKSSGHFGFFVTPKPPHFGRAVAPPKDGDRRIARVSILPPPRARGGNGCIAL